MTVEFSGVSTASLGAMLKGFGIMAGIGTVSPDARFWWTPAGALATKLGCLDGRTRDSAHEAATGYILPLAAWASERGKAFEKPRKRSRREVGPDGIQRTVVEREGGDAPLKDEIYWKELDEELAFDAESVGVFIGDNSHSNPVLGSWGQDGSANLFSALREAGDSANPADINSALFGGEVPPSKHLAKGSGVLFPEGIKRYATGNQWIHEKKKPLGMWEFILAMRGLILLRGAVRSPRGSRFKYPSFPFIRPGSVVHAQGSIVQTEEIFLPTWNRDRPRELAEFQAQVQSFQARVGFGEFSSGAADFRRAISGRAVTGGFDAFHRFALEPRKPGQREPQRQAVARGLTLVGQASAAGTSMRLLLARLDDSNWLEKFRSRRADPTSEKLALAKTRFDKAVHTVIDAGGESADSARYVDVLKALWDLQVTLSRRKERIELFRPAPLLEGRAWQRVLWDHLKRKTAARLGWALASLGWASVKDEDGQSVTKPIIEQLLPVKADGDHGLSVLDPWPAHRVDLPGKNPSREFADLFWRRWLDNASLPVLPFRGTRPVDAADVAALLCGEVDLKELQRYLVAFLILDRSGDTPRPTRSDRPVKPAYAALRLWIELAASPARGERRPLDGTVPRGVATGTVQSVSSACRVALRRLQVSGMPGRWPEDSRPTGKSVAQPTVQLMMQSAALMATALLVPVCNESAARLADSLYVPAASDKPGRKSRMETDHV